ncbi:hypothetical protein FRB94_010373 [Tulasnella sp. JGI-2019a]|nr:hypothetical protein FRB94_010373 [Tulasnella sp. JGI-2019a]
MDIVSNPDLATQTAKSFAITAWKTSKLYGRNSIRIYREENGGVRELCSIYSSGVLRWKRGRIIPSVGGVSGTAPLAAAHSFGSGPQQERMAVYYIAQDNHLRDLIFFESKWTQGDLDVPLGNEVCTGLHATWHLDKESNSIWTICYTTAKEIHFRKEIRNDLHKPPIVEMGTLDHPSDKPLTLVVNNEPDRDAILMGTGDAGYLGNRYTLAFTSLPLHLGTVHRIAGIDCDPKPEMRFFVTERDTLNQYTFDRNS